MKPLKMNYGKTMPVLLALLAAACGYGPLHAETGTLLGRYITRAIEHNPELAAARERSMAAREAVGVARTLPDPQFSYNQGLGAKARHYELTAVQPVPWPGRLKAQTDAAAFTALAAEAQFDDLQNDILMKLRSVFTGLYAVRKKALLLQQTADYLLQEEKMTAAAYAAGTRTQMALLKLQLERTGVTDRIQSLQADEAVLKEEMGALLDLPAADIEVPASPTELPVPAFDYAVAISLDQNPAVTALRYRINAAERKSAAARRSLMPDLMAGIKYEPAPAGGEWHLLTGITVPLWLPARFAEIRMNDAGEREARENLRKELAGLRAEAGSLHHLYTDAVRRIALLDSSLIPLAEQALQATAAHYRTGTGGVTDLLETLRTVVDLRIRKTVLEEQREKLAAEIVLCCLGQGQ